MEVSRSLLIVSSNFPPMSGAGVYRTLRMARYLPALGWKVHVLTIAPRCYEPGVPVDGRLLAKIPDSVEVHQTAIVYPLAWLNRLREPLRSAGEPVNGNGRDAGAATHSASQSGLLRQLKDTVSLWLTTPDRHIGWVPFAVAAGRRVIRQQGIFAIYSSGPPWTNHLVGYRLKQSTGRPWVADFRDPWIGASNVRPIRGSDTWAGRRHRRLERRVVESADHVVVNTLRSRDDFINRYGNDVASKFTVVPNGFDPADYDGLAAQPPRQPSAKLTIAHAGSFYATRNVNGLIEAVGNLCRAGAIRPGSLEIRLIGGVRPGRTEEETRVKATGAEDVIKLTPRVPHHECLQQLNNADVLLLVQVGTPLSVPGKAFEYIALGKPMFVLADAGATTDLVEREGLGVWAEPHNVPAIQETLLHLYERFSTGTSLPRLCVEVRDHHDGRVLVQKLDSVLRTVLAR